MFPGGRKEWSCSLSADSVGCVPEKTRGSGCVLFLLCVDVVVELWTIRLLLLGS